jgi:hypothetical protein
VAVNDFLQNVNGGFSRLVDGMPLMRPARRPWGVGSPFNKARRPTAAIWRNDVGLELHVENNGELIESRSSRVGEGPLLLIA